MPCQIVYLYKSHTNFCIECGFLLHLFLIFLRKNGSFIKIRDEVDALYDLRSSINKEAANRNLRNSEIRAIENINKDIAIILSAKQNIFNVLIDEINQDAYDDKKIKVAIYLKDRKAKELKEYVVLLEEAKKRDHRKIGKELGLFTFSEKVGLGLPLWLPKGAALRDRLIEFMKNEQMKAGYVQVSTPHIGHKNLYTFLIVLLRV